MDFHVTVAATADADVHDLRQWLIKQPLLRGRVRRADGAVPVPGTMGLAADALLAVLAPGGVASVLAGAVIAWVQTRKGDQSVTLTRPDGSQISVTSTQVRALDAAQLETLARRLAAQLEPVADSTTGAAGPPDAPSRSADRNENRGTVVRPDDSPDGGTRAR